MKFTKGELLFILYVVLTVFSTISGVLNDNYEEKLQTILKKLAILTDEVNKSEEK